MRGENGQPVPATLRILVVDSRSKSSEHVKGLLRECSYEQVQLVRTSKEAIELLLREVQARPTEQPFDLILKDHEPPQINAIRLLRKLAEEPRLSGIPLIAYSSQDNKETVYKCLHSGAVDYLVKPLRLNEVRNLWTRVYFARLSSHLVEARITPPAAMNPMQELRRQGQGQGSSAPGERAGHAAADADTKSQDTVPNEEEEPTSKEGSAPDEGNGAGANGGSGNGASGRPRPGGGHERERERAERAERAEKEAADDKNGDSRGNGSNGNGNGNSASNKHGSNGNGASTTRHMDKNRGGAGGATEGGQQDGSKGGTGILDTHPTTTSSQPTAAKPGTGVSAFLAYRQVQHEQQVVAHAREALTGQANAFEMMPATRSQGDNPTASQPKPVNNNSKSQGGSAKDGTNTNTVQATGTSGLPGASGPGTLGASEGTNTRINSLPSGETHVGQQRPHSTGRPPVTEGSDGFKTYKPGASPGLNQHPGGDTSPRLTRWPGGGSTGNGGGSSGGRTQPSYPAGNHHHRDPHSAGSGPGMVLQPYGGQQQITSRGPAQNAIVNPFAAFAPPGPALGMPDASAQQAATAAALNMNNAAATAAMNMNAAAMSAAAAQQMQQSAAAAMAANPFLAGYPSVGPFTPMNGGSGMGGVMPPYADPLSSGIGGGSMGAGPMPPPPVKGSVPGMPAWMQGMPGLPGTAKDGGPFAGPLMGMGLQGIGLGPMGPGGLAHHLPGAGGWNALLGPLGPLGPPLPTTSSAGPAEASGNPASSNPFANHLQLRSSSDGPAMAGHLAHAAVAHAAAAAVAAAATAAGPAVTQPLSMMTDGGGSQGPRATSELGMLVEPSRAERRLAALNKYRVKRKTLNFQKRVRYESRRELAQSRPRNRGQFVKKDGAAAAATGTAGTGQNTASGRADLEDDGGPQSTGVAMQDPAAAAGAGEVFAEGTAVAGGARAAALVAAGLADGVEAQGPSPASVAPLGARRQTRAAAAAAAAAALTGFLAPGKSGSKAEQEQEQEQEQGSPAPQAAQSESEEGMAAEDDPSGEDGPGGEGDEDGVVNSPVELTEVMRASAGTRGEHREGAVASGGGHGNPSVGHPTGSLKRAYFGSRDGPHSKKAFIEQDQQQRLADKNKNNGSDSGSNSPHEDGGNGNSGPGSQGDAPQG